MTGPVKNQAVLGSVAASVASAKNKKITHLVKDAARIVVERPRIQHETLCEPFASSSTPSEDLHQLLGPIFGSWKSSLRGALAAFQTQLHAVKEVKYDSVRRQIEAHPEVFRDWLRGVVQSLVVFTLSCPDPTGCSLEDFLNPKESKILQEQVKAVQCIKLHLEDHPNDTTAFEDVIQSLMVPSESGPTLSEWAELFQRCGPPSSQ